MALTKTPVELTKTPMVLTKTPVGVLVTTTGVLVNTTGALVNTTKNAHITFTRQRDIENCVGPALDVWSFVPCLCTLCFCSPCV